MTDLTIRQAVSVWSDLERAYMGVNGYGGHTAEIYAYRLQTRNPSAEATSTSFSKTAMFKHAAAEAGTEAGLNLTGLLDLFFETHECAIIVDDSPTWRGELPLGLWHRCHVTIMPKGKR